MAKIVPGLQTTDLGLYDEFDDYMDVLDFLTRVGQTYTDVSARQNNESKDYLNSLLTLINDGYVSSSADMSKMEEQYTASQENIDTDDAMIGMLNTAVGSAINQGKTRIGMHEKSFNNLYTMATDVNNMLSQNPDESVYNHKAMEDMPMKYLHATMASFQTNAAGVGFDFTTGKMSEKFKNYMGEGGWNTNQMGTYIMNTYNKLMTIKKAKRNQISNEEWEYMLTNPSLTEFGEVSKNIVSDADNNIKNTSSRISAAKKALNSIEIGYDSTLYDIINKGLSEAESEDEADVFNDTRNNIQAEFGDLESFNSFMQYSPDLLRSKADEARKKSERRAELDLKLNEFGLTEEEEEEYNAVYTTPAEDALISFGDTYDKIISGLRTSMEEDTILLSEARAKKKRLKQMVMTERLLAPQSISLKM